MIYSTLHVNLLFSYTVLPDLEKGKRKKTRLPDKNNERKEKQGRRGKRETIEQRE
jgi:hypothetical protein